ncbi:MAG: hypothetical protein EPO28_05260 [Saprospiraceae bacterium]|nr:MAG: hypothetical protein EPO28_05260 [Saprospiraceae bacterium]
MDKKLSLSIRLELVWWMATALLLAAVLFPIYKTRADYHFWTTNILFVLVFVTFTRYIFLLKHTFLARLQWAKVAVIIMCIPLFIYLIKVIHLFQLYLDQIGLQDIFAHLSYNGQIHMARYVQAEMLFFGAASIIVTIILPFRMLISFWRTLNRGTV